MLFADPNDVYSGGITCNPTKKILNIASQLSALTCVNPPTVRTRIEISDVAASAATVLIITTSSTMFTPFKMNNCIKYVSNFNLSQNCTIYCLPITRSKFCVCT